MGMKEHVKQLKLQFVCLKLSAVVWFYNISQTSLQQVNRHTLGRRVSMTHHAGNDIILLDFSQSIDIRITHKNNFLLVKSSFSHF